MRAVDTPELRLVYIDPQETFLVPHAVRTFLNSIAFQRRVFGLDTKKPINVLLTDFQDAGNAGATVVPYDAVTVQIAPLSFAFETIAGNDRMNIIMVRASARILSTIAGRSGRPRLLTNERSIFKASTGSLCRWLSDE